MKKNSNKTITDKKKEKANSKVERKSMFRHVLWHEIAVFIQVTPREECIIEKLIEIKTTKLYHATIIKFFFQ